LQRRQQNRCQNCDDGNYNEKLNKSKAVYSFTLSADRVKLYTALLCRPTERKYCFEIITHLLVKIVFYYSIHNKTIKNKCFLQKIPEKCCFFTNIEEFAAIQLKK